MDVLHKLCRSIFRRSLVSSNIDVYESIFEKIQAKKAVVVHHVSHDHSMLKRSVSHGYKDLNFSICFDSVGGK